MLKAAFLFPGQGAQYAGMGREICGVFPKAREVYEKASEVLGYNMEDLCFGDDPRLHLTEYTQPAIVTTSIAVLEAVEAMGVRASAAAGLSLGEYSALVCARSMDFETGVAVVSKRGKFMQEAAPPGEGTMATIIGLDRDSVAEACRRASQGSSGVVELANLNCPGQIVISGAAAAVGQAGQIARELGAARVIPLKVSGPFHSSLLGPAAERLAYTLDDVAISDAIIPVYSNVTARAGHGSDEIRRLLVAQVTSPVLWEDTIRNMCAAGIGAFVEIGPGRVLSGFMKRIAPEARVWNVEDLKSLEALEAAA